MHDPIPYEQVEWPEQSPWDDTTDYRTTYHVAQQHPLANDSNPGSSDAPLASIQAALDRVQPGEKIMIGDGLYREWLRPRRGGTAPNAMVYLQASPGANVTVSGAEPLQGLWHRPRLADAADCPGEARGLVATSQKVIVVDVDPALLPPHQSSWLLPNVTEHEQSLMEWMEPVGGTAPFNRRRAMLFQGEQRLLQLNDPADVNQVAGSFLVSADGTQILIHTLDAKIGSQIDPEEFELAVRPHCLAPETPAVNYFHVHGVHFTRCANSFLRTGAGAVSNKGGSYWRIEQCRISQCNSAGVECSDLGSEHADRNHPAWRHRGEGHNIIRGNTIETCGTAGIRSLTVQHGFVCHNHIFNCGWQQAEYYYECAGIKLLLNKHTLVSGNDIHDIDGGCGIWMDWDNKHSHVTKNVIRNIDGMQGGIFLEASYHPNKVDSNVIWNCSGFGIFGGDSANQHYENNLIAHCAGAAIKLICHTNRSINKRPVTCVNNHVTGNVFYKSSAHDVEALPNYFKNNTYITDNTDTVIEQEPYETGSQWVNGKLNLDTDGISWALTSDPGQKVIPQAEGHRSFASFLHEPELEPETVE